MFHVYSSCLLIIDLQIQPQQPSLTCFFLFFLKLHLPVYLWWCEQGPSTYQCWLRLRLFPSSPWGEAFSGRSKTVEYETWRDDHDDDNDASLLRQAEQFVPQFVPLPTNSALCKHVLFFVFQECFCNRPLSLKYQTTRKNTWRVQWSNLKFGDRRDDRGLGFEVGQVHGSGEQQQRWRNIFFQVQVKPLDGGQHLLQTDNRTTCSDYINLTKKIQQISSYYLFQDISRHTTFLYFDSVKVTAKLREDTVHTFTQHLNAAK